MAEEWREMFAPFRGQSDEEITATAKSMGGIEYLVGAILNGMASSLDPAKAEDVVLGYRLTDTDRDYTYAIVVKDKVAKVEQRELDDARTTYVISAQDFLRLLAGDLDGTTAFQSGRVKIEGDQMFAMQSQGMFAA